MRSVLEHDNIDQIAPKRLVWNIERVAGQVSVSHYDLARLRDQREAVTFLQYAVHDAAHACARHIVATCFIGKREEKNTVAVPYVGSVPYTHVRSWEEREYAPWPEWLQVLFLLTCPWLWWPRHKVVQKSEELTGRVVYRGTTPYTYTHTTMIDPFIEDHYGPLVRDGRVPPYIEMAAYDYPNATWRVE